MWIKELGNGFQLREVDREELERIQGPHFDRVFSNRNRNAAFPPLSAEDDEKILARRKSQSPWVLRLGLYLNGEVVGWHVGMAQDPETYYMRNSVVLEEFRRRGLYARMLDHVLERLNAEGFQVVTSLHHPNNTAVLIPKLKKGFILTGVQLHERFRFLVEMKFFFSGERRRAYEKLIGLEQP